MPFIAEAGPDTMVFASANMPTPWFAKLTETFTYSPLGAYRAALLAAVGLDDPYKGSPLADCLKRRFRLARVAPFDGKARALGVRFTL